MANDGGISVALNVRPPFPARGVRVARSDEFRLQALKFLLVAKFVGL